MKIALEYLAMTIEVFIFEGFQDVQKLYQCHKEKGR